MSRERVEATPRKAFTKRQRAEAFLRAEGRCECGCKTKITGAFDINHKIPLAHGGAHEPGNWEVLLPEHHRELTKVHATQTAKIKRQSRKFGVDYDPDQPRPVSRLKSAGFNRELTKGFDGKVRKRKQPRI